MSGITSLHLRVHFANGETAEVHTANPDQVRWEETAAKHGWPTTEMVGDRVVNKAPTLWLTFMAFAALRRTGALPDTAAKWDTFKNEACHGVEVVETEEADPTPPGVDTDSV